LHLEKEIQKKQEYWKHVLQRVIAVVSIMLERGLAFMWTNEKPDSPHNGDFLDLTELTIKFYPFLANPTTNTVELGDLRCLHTCLKTVYDDISLMLRK
jgi:hypothetical protein